MRTYDLQSTPTEQYPGGCAPSCAPARPELESLLCKFSSFYLFLFVQARRICSFVSRLNTSKNTEPSPAAKLLCFVLPDLEFNSPRRKQLLFPFFSLYLFRSGIAPEYNLVSVQLQTSNWASPVVVLTVSLYTGDLSSNFPQSTKSTFFPSLFILSFIFLQHVKSCICYIF